MRRTDPEFAGYHRGCGCEVYEVSDGCEWLEINGYRSPRYESHLECEECGEIYSDDCLSSEEACEHCRKQPVHEDGLCERCYENSQAEEAAYEAITI